MGVAVSYISATANGDQKEEARNECNYLIYELKGERGRTIMAMTHHKVKS